MKSIDEMIAVMEASKAKEIESRLVGSDKWARTTQPSWNWGLMDYRVKAQEPARVWMALCETNSTGDFWHPYHSESALRKDGSSCIKRGAEFIELTPEIRNALGL